MTTNKMIEKRKTLQPENSKSTKNSNYRDKYFSMIHRVNGVVVTCNPSKVELRVRFPLNANAFYLLYL